MNFVSSELSGTIRPYDAQKAFQRAARGQLELIEPEFVNAFRVHESGPYITEHGFRRLRGWLREMKMTTEQGF